jgi:hypothetical protein
VPDDFLHWMELLNYFATVIGIPLAITTFVRQQRKERQNEEEEIYEKLMEHYAQVQTMLFEHPELDQHDKSLENGEDIRRQRILYDMLVSLFERAFILLHGEDKPAYRRMWNSWNDYINYWARYQNFRNILPELMKGEDPEFVAFMAGVTELPLKP